MPVLAGACRHADALVGLARVRRAQTAVRRIAQAGARARKVHSMTTHIHTVRFLSLHARLRFPSHLYTSNLRQSNQVISRQNDTPWIIRFILRPQGQVSHIDTKAYGVLECLLGWRPSAAATRVLPMPFLLNSMPKLPIRIWSDEEDVVRAEGEVRHDLIDGLCRWVE